MRTNRLLSLLAVPALLLASAALAQDAKKSPEERLDAAIDALQAACKGDAQKYCSSVSPGEGRLFFCMLAHEDKISNACDYAIYKTVNDVAWVLDKVEEAADACSEDLQKYCSAAEPGQGEVASCLAKHEASLGEACRSVARKLTAR